MYERKLQNEMVLFSCILKELVIDETRIYIVKR